MYTFRQIMNMTRPGAINVIINWSTMYVTVIHFWPGYTFDDQATLYFIHLYSILTILEMILNDKY